ncbi:TonB-dependent receptor domain-containing protein [Pseudidiomarina mangrovi]|uniref:TonB-dependent receptor domain-containing protein n=1 Tax=Pseudidiomarina mangrovi TaxID=2487133 RepID=UPI000FCC8074|nr:TonB-dependent receptor [Pseudidiomarina mangrovi]
MLKNLELKRSPLALAIGYVLVGGGITSAQAQDTEATEDSTAREGTEKITVVGSRIRTDGLDSASPVEIISASEAIGQGLVTLGDLLRTSTVAAGSNQVTAAASTAFVTEGGTGTETLSLRGLGANRTLVLLNGRRIGPAGTRGQVSAFDLNIMPLAAVERVEILKDGASSLYGSDAVAGVVNIVTKTGDESAFDVNLSQPNEAGGETMRMSGSFGRSYDSGSFRLVADYQRVNELANGDRDFFDCGNNYLFDPSNGERADLVDPRTGEFRCNDLPWGHVWVYDYAPLFTGDSNVPTRTLTLAQYDYDNNLGGLIPSFNQTANDPYDMRTPEGWYPVNYDRVSNSVTNADHPFQDLETLSPEQEIVTVFGAGELWLDDTTTLYSEVLLNRRKTTTNGYRQFWTYIYNGNFDFFNFDVGNGNGSPLSQGWTGAQWLSPTPITNHSGSEITVDYRRFVVGLEGTLGDYDYDISIQDSRSDGDYKNKIIYNDSIEDQWFNYGSCVGTQTSVRGADCIDVPWLDPQFLAGNISSDVRDFLFGEEIGNTVYKQRTFEAVLSGEAFEINELPIGFAVGLSYQQDSILDTPGEQTLLSNTWGMSSAGITEGKQNTRALFTELNIPLLRDLPFAQQVEMTLSGRYTDVSTYGSDRTFKASLNWLIDDGLRVRASRGTSFRSPALYELFLNNQSSFVGQRTVDPCINYETALANNQISEITRNNCAADGIPPDYVGGASSATVITGGGLGQLEAETSVAETFGVVWIPSWTDFSMSVDYFNFEIDGEVTLLSASQIVRGCYASENFDTEPLCDQFFRNNLDLRVEEITGKYLNIAKQINRGIDVQLNYPFSTEFAEFDITYEHTIQIEASRQLFAASEPVDRVGEFGSPKHVGNLRLTMKQDDWTYNWTSRYIGAVSNHERYGLGTYREDANFFGQQVRLVLDSSPVIYHAVSATRDFRDAGVSVTFGIANLFDKEPPKVSDRGGVSRMGNTAFYSQYDWLGRRAFVNLSYQF